MSKIQKVHISIDGKTTCYVPYKEYKSMKKSYEDKIRNLKKQKAEEIEKENGFKIETFGGYEWYVIKETENEKLLFMKDKLPVDKIKEIFNVNLLDSYNDVKFNPNDKNIWWNDSPIRMALNSKFLENLDKTQMNLMNITVSIDDKERNTEDYVRLITKEEAEKLPTEIIKCSGNYGYWTMSPSIFHSNSPANEFIVASSGVLSGWHDVDAGYGVRPVISIKNNKVEE